MQKEFRVYRRLIAAASAFCGLVLFCAAAGVPFQTTSAGTRWNVLFLAVGVMVYLALAFGVYRRAKSASNRALTVAAGVLLGGMAALLLIFGLQVQSNSLWDLVHLHNAAVSRLETGSYGHDAYFGAYPFQRYWAICIAGIYRAGAAFGLAPRVSGTLAGAAMLLLTVLCAWRLLLRLSGRAVAFLCLFLLVTNPAFYLYASYYYTDLPGMLCVALVLLLAVHAEQEQRRWLYLPIGVIAFFGYCVRTTSFIAMIAVWLYLLLRRCKGGLICAALSVLGIVACRLLMLALLRQSGMEAAPDSALPAVHWLMLGLTRNGKYDEALYQYTLSFPTSAEKTAADLAYIRQFYQENGLYRFFELLPQKWSNVWSDGTCAAANYYTAVTRHGLLWRYTLGGQRLFTEYGAQIVRCAVLPGALAACFKARRAEYHLPLIFLLGYMFFYTFWEGMPRYALTALPVLILLAAAGLAALFEHVKLPCRRTIRRSWGVLALFTALALALYAKPMAINAQDRDYLRAANTVSQTEAPVSTAAITQTFRTDQPFNRIELQLKNHAAADTDQYVFRLLQGSEILATERFNASTVGNQYYRAFRFNTVAPAGEQTYCVELFAAAPYDAPLTVRAATVENGDDYYEKGACSGTGGVLQELCFRVSWRTRGGYVTRRFYGCFSAVVLLAECAAYLLLRKKENEYGTDSVCGHSML